MSCDTDEINDCLDEVTAGCFVTPYAAFALINKALAPYGIVLPQKYFEGIEGSECFPLPDEDCYLYFEWWQEDDGKYSVFANIVDDDDLDDILDDDEDGDDDNEDDL